MFIIPDGVYTEMNLILRLSVVNFSVGIFSEVFSEMTSILRLWPAFSSAFWGVVHSHNFHLCSALVTGIPRWSPL